MYKRSYIILSFIIVIVFVALTIIQPQNQTAPDVFFPSPEEAIEQQLLSNDYTLVNNNGVCFAVCNTDVNDYACQYIVNNGKGWQVVTDYMFRNEYFSKREKNGLYEIYIREYNDKYFIYISQTKNSINENGIIDVKDSLNSVFSEMEHVYLIDEHYWFLCLDEFPQEYSITINNDMVFSK